MNLKQASINDIQGEGQATIRTVGGMKQVDGKFIASSPTANFKLMDSKKTLFTGVLYDGCKETNLTFSVIVTNISNNVVTFKGTGNPYSS
ncbi:hypothetical protein P4S57_20995 [Pseudoalteromonas sp. Hal273]